MVFCFFFLREILRTYQIISSQVTYQIHFPKLHAKLHLLKLHTKFNSGREKASEKCVADLELQQMVVLLSYMKVEIWQELNYLLMLCDFLVLRGLF